MNVYRLLRRSLDALRIEDEFSLAYLHGTKFESLPHLSDKRSRLPCVFFRVLIFFRSLLLGLQLKPISFGSVEVIVYSGTDNQLNSLLSTLRSLENKKINRMVLLGKAVRGVGRDEVSDHMVVKYSFSVVFVAVLLFLARASKVYWSLKKRQRKILINQYFNVFCSAYVYLPYFLRILSLSKPELVVMSNDHNVDNRSLRLAAEISGVKTLYMQHASVSELFPPLEYDYALLDGRMALNSYMRCNELLRGSSQRVRVNSSKCQVYLCGQKKNVRNGLSGTRIKYFAGIAVNALDEFQALESILTGFVKTNETCLVRTHPYQPPEFVDKLKAFADMHANIELSNAKTEKLLEFFSKIKCMIAANSSIHLEAALAGLPTFYKEMSGNVHYQDYYGYVKNGVSREIQGDVDIRQLHVDIERGHASVRTHSIQQYSETYCTGWQDREGELAAIIIDGILNTAEVNSIFKREESEIFQSVWGLGVTK